MPYFAIPQILRYKDSLKTIVDKLAELEDELTTMYSNGVAVGFTKESLGKQLGVPFVDEGEV